MKRPPQTILISQAGCIEDVVLTTPVATALRHHHPNARVVWAVDAAASAVVGAADVADEIIEVPDRWTHQPAEWLRVRQQLRSMGIDVALQCESSTPGRMGASKAASLISGARQRIELSRGPSRWRWPRSRRQSVPAVFQHHTDRQLELLIPLGIHHVHPRWPAFCGVSARAWARGFRQSLPASPIMLMHPAGRNASAQWETDRFASTARYARDRYHYQTMVTWRTFEERLLAEEVVSLSQDAANLAPDTSVQALAALVELADVVVSGDACPLHLAVAAGTPTIGIYGGTDPSNLGPYDRPAIRLETPAKPGRWHSSKMENTEMLAVGVQHVCAVLDQIESPASRNQRPLAASAAA